MRQGFDAGAGGLSPVVLTDFSSVTVVLLPPGAVVVWVVLVLASSEQPERPMPKPMTTTPIIIPLISFRMTVVLDPRKTRRPVTSPEIRRPAVDDGFKRMQRPCQR